MPRRNWYVFFTINDSTVMRRFFFEKTALAWGRVMTDRAFLMWMDDDTIDVAASVIYMNRKVDRFEGRYQWSLTDRVAS